MNQLISLTAETITLRKAFTDYLVMRPLKETTRKNYVLRILNRLSEWLDTPLSEITRTMVLIKHREMSATGPALANSTFRTLKAVYNFAAAFYEDAEGEPMILKNPVVKLSQVAAWNKDRRRRRSIALELGPWFRAVMSLEKLLWRDYWIITLLTGMRKTESLSLQWNNVNLSTGVIQLHDTKNGDDREIPMSDAVWKILARRKYLAQTGAKHVFPGKLGQHMSCVKKSLDEVKERSGVSFSTHDLRRTFATIGDECDIKSEVMKQLLGHRGDVTEDYTIRSIERLRRASQKITTHIMILSQQERQTMEVRHGLFSHR